MRMQSLQQTSPVPPLLEFDKDDEDILDFVASSANLRSIIFGIEPKSKFDIKQMAGNIIPAIATTNAMTAGLCVLQALKVLKGNLEKAKMVFLERSASRVVNSEQLHPPNPDCAVCSVAQTQLQIDPSRAILKDLVDGVLKAQLGYNEFSITNDVGTLYDPDLEDNLSKTFSELGVKNGNLLTVIDDEDENPRVNLSLAVSETYVLCSDPWHWSDFTNLCRSLPSDSPSVRFTEKIEIPRRPKTSELRHTNGESNGVSEATPTGAKRKRSAGEGEQEQTAKKEKLQTNGNGANDSVVIEGPDDGSIVIDD